MRAYQLLPVRYIKHIPALYFAGLGVYHIGSDVWNDSITTWGVLLNATFLIPLIARHKATYITFGILFGSLGLFIAWGVTVNLRRHTGLPDTEFIAVVLNTILLIANAAALIYLGVKMDTKGNAVIT